jgi:hypothetical protein
LVLFVVPVFVGVYALVAPALKRRFGLLGLVVVAYAMWALLGRLTSLAAAPGERQGLGNLALLADLIGAVALVIICVQVQRRSEAGSAAINAARALAIGAALENAIVLAGLILIVQMAP